ncbi:DNA-methyltransferase [Nocardia puris]|uniref:Methyltransferase n=1 Tax=Nocardia puris TaxID=208602 RepID=A0A366DAS0_9NOCA|nr:site-specific DNA-methyltransferase [Nocardia puris]RBO87045.1 site-specific DNA-methyltransferase (adenine-specific) [Nocardia puris]
MNADSTLTHLEIGTSRIVHGESLATMRQLAEHQFDAVIADPPYCSGGVTAADRTSRTAAQKYVSTDSKSGHALPDFGGDQRDQRSFTIWSSIWLGEALRLTRPGGQLLAFTDWRQLPALSDALQVAGWRWRGIVVWAKPGARPQPGFANGAEYILWGSHGVLGPDHKPPCLPGVYSITRPTGRQRQHITAKPVELMRHLVRTVQPGGLILDPFAGSGTTGVAAILEGRRFLGIEGSPEYADIARRRLADIESAPPTDAA